MKRYKDLTPEERREYHKKASRKNYAANREKYRERNLAYYYANLQVRQEYQRDYWRTKVKPLHDEAVTAVLKELAETPEEDRAALVEQLMARDNSTRRALRDFRVDGHIADYIQ